MRVKKIQGIQFHHYKLCDSTLLQLNIWTLVMVTVKRLWLSWLSRSPCFLDRSCMWPETTLLSTRTPTHRHHVPLVRAHTCSFMVSCVAQRFFQVPDIFRLLLCDFILLLLDLPLHLAVGERVTLKMSAWLSTDSQIDPGNPTSLFLPCF